jgi:hypothetical protein
VRLPPPLPPTAHIGRPPEALARRDADARAAIAVDLAEAAPRAREGQPGQPEEAQIDARTLERARLPARVARYASALVLLQGDVDSAELALKAADEQIQSEAGRIVVNHAERLRRRMIEAEQLAKQLRFEVMGACGVVVPYGQPNIGGAKFSPELINIIRV